MYVLMGYKKTSRFELDAVRSRHLPSFAVICRHLPSFAVICRHLPSDGVRCRTFRVRSTCPIQERSIGTWRFNINFTYKLWDSKHYEMGGRYGSNKGKRTGTWPYTNLRCTW